MKYLTTLLTLIACATITQAQYNKPNSIAYDPVNKDYYVSNTGDATITRLDASFKTSTVITSSNLVEPKGLFFINTGSYTLLIVLDVNKIRVFDPVNYSLLQTNTVTGATNLEDAVLDPGNPNVFYLSDRGGNKIIRGELGPPPLYSPTFSDLATGIDRPTGLFFDNKGRLLMVQDTTDSPISQIDTSNGNITTLKSTALDGLNAIIQDGQGNFFITSWGDDNLYRFTPDFSDSVKITTFNDPSGFYFNEPQDLLLVACSNCNKLEFFKLHSFIPLAAVSGCPGDSATVYFNPTYKSIGTFNANNQFFVDISDDQGNFSPPYVAGKLVSAEDPGPIRIKLKEDNYGNGNLKYRVRSTSPFILSPEYSLYILPLPDAKASDYDRIGSCVNASIKLGTSAIKDYIYSWTPAANLDDSTLAAPTFTSVSSREDTLYLTVTNTKTGCKAMDTVIISTNPDLSLPQLKDIVSVCGGDSVPIGVVNSPYLFKWTPNFAIDNDSISNPVTWTPGDVKYYVTFMDTTSGCQGNDSVIVLVNVKPLKPYYPDQELCLGKKTTLITFEDTTATYKWSPSAHLNTDTLYYVEFTADTTGTFDYTVTATNAAGCFETTKVTITVHPNPTPVITSLTYIKDPAGDSIELIWSDTTTESLGTLVVKDSTSGMVEIANSFGEGRVVFPISLFDDYWQVYRLSFDYLVYANDVDHGCFGDNGSFEYFSYQTGSVRNANSLRFTISPNPSEGHIAISGDLNTVSSVHIVNSNGQRVLELNGDPDWSNVDISKLSPGFYVVLLTDTDGNSGTQKLMLH